MNKIFTLFLISLLVISFNTFALAKDNSPGTPSPGAILVDILVFRPVGLAGFILGSAAYVISLPITIPFNRSHEVSEVLVMEPYRYTFARSLGRM